MSFRSELAGLSSLGIVCDDCGRRKRWPRPKLADAEATYRVFSLQQLGSRLRCSYCVEREGDGRNITLWPTSTLDCRTETKSA